MIDDGLRIDMAQFQTYPRPLLIIEMPRAVSDEAAMLAFDIMRRLADELLQKYGVQIQRAKAERQRAIEDYHRDQDMIRREQEFRAAQLDIDLYKRDEDEPD